MSDEFNIQNDSDELVLYQIRIKGHLRTEWKEWFEGMTITLGEDGDTLLTGQIMDQAALHGLLKKVRDSGLPLVSINPIRPGQADRKNIHWREK